METVVGGLFNAVAFAGAGFLFSKLNHTGYEKEIKRHNEAMEKLSRDKEIWMEKQMERKTKLEELCQQLSDVKADINRTNKSFENLEKINYRVKKLQNEYEEEEKKEPKLENYYKPSNEMKEYQNVVFLLVGITGGYLIHKLSGNNLLAKSL